MTRPEDTFDPKEKKGKFSKPKPELKMADPSNKKLTQPGSQFYDLGPSQDFFSD